MIPGLHRLSLSGANDEKRTVPTDLMTKFHKPALEPQSKRVKHNSDADAPSPPVGEPRNEACPISLVDFEENQDVWESPSGHLYAPLSIYSWLKEGNWKDPMTREVIPRDGEIGEGGLVSFFKDKTVAETFLATIKKIEGELGRATPKEDMATLKLRAKETIEEALKELESNAPYAEGRPGEFKQSVEHIKNWESNFLTELSHCDLVSSFLFAITTNTDLSFYNELLASLTDAGENILTPVRYGWIDRTGRRTAKGRERTILYLESVDSILKGMEGIFAKYKQTLSPAKSKRLDRIVASLRIAVPFVCVKPEQMESFVANVAQVDANSWSP